MIFAARIQSESLVWPLAETGSLLRLEPRKSRTHAQLPTRCTDATCLDSPTAGRSVFFATPVNSTRLGHKRPFSPAIETPSPSPAGHLPIRPLPFALFHTWR